MADPLMPSEIELVDVIRVRVIEPSAKKEYYIPKELLQRHAPKLAEVIVLWYELEMFNITDYDIETFDLFTIWLKNNNDNAFMDNYRWPTALVDFAISHLNIAPTHAEVQHAYKNTASGSPLRHIIVKAFCATKHDFSHASGEYDHDFLLYSLRYKEEIQNNIDAAMDDAVLSNENEGRKIKTPADELTPQELNDMQEEFKGSMEMDYSDLILEMDFSEGDDAQSEIQYNTDDMFDRVGLFLDSE